MKKIYFVLLLLLALTGCGAADAEEDIPQVPETSQGQEVPEIQEPRQEETQPTLNTSVIEGRPGELDFAFSLEKWITAFDRQYQADMGVTYLKPAEEWRTWDAETGVHSQQPTTYHEFIENEQMYNLPTMTVYTPPEGGCVQEITLDFDDHAYLDSAYELYEELCYYTIRTLLPELEEAQITEIYETCNEICYGDLRLNHQRYSSAVVPVVLYYKDGVGFYPHFALGDYVRLCAIPVTEESLQGFAQKGTQLRPIQ